jgi:D-alanine-D-alanine ligase
MGNDSPQASVCGEIFPGDEFYSYNAKYHDAESKVVIPANIPEETSNKIRDLAIKAFQACDLAGLARVDFFIDKDNEEIYINELNTMPGFTEISMYPQLWEATGLNNKDLIEKLIEYALERKSQRDATNHTLRRVV